MKQFRCLSTSVLLMALALPQFVMGQEVELVAQDATYDYLLTIKDVGGSGLAVDPTVDPSFAFIGPSADTNVAIWPFAEYDPVGANNIVNGAVRDTGAPETLEWRQADGPFVWGDVAGINNPTDPLIDSGLPFTEAQLDGQKLTQYFRTNFTTTETIDSIFLDVLIDDAAVFYIDGFEVARYNCCQSPDGTAEPLFVGAPFFDSVTENNGDVGNETIRNNNWDAPFVAGSPNEAVLDAFGGTLAPGEHVFAASVHSYGSFTSSDLGFDVRLFTFQGEDQWEGLSGSWTNANNWTLSIPNGVDAEAKLLQVPTAPTTIYHNGGVTFGTLTIDNANKYAIAGLGTFTVETSGANGLIEVLQGDHEFQAPVAIAVNTDVNVAENASLEFNNDLSLNGNSLTLGGMGTVSVNNAVFTGGGAINAAAGAIAGDGSIHGDLINTGARLSPGSTAGGMLTIDGNYSQGPDGVIEIELVGADVYDQLAVEGELEFGGTLVVSLLDGFEPDHGDEFGLFTFASSAGSFDTVMLPALGDGLAWDASQLHVAGNLAVIPEPTGILMLLLGGFGLIHVIRRRS